jgi:beta-glucanase (GH16 family)
LKKLNIIVLMLIVLVFAFGCEKNGMEIPDECAHLRVEDGWVPVWCDEFDGVELNEEKWTSLNTSWGGGNNEAQYYHPDNIEVKDGMLVITAKKENYGGKNYTSGRIHTQYKGDWLYGKIVVRAKLPGGRGTWPAIWMLPTMNKYGTWPKSGEIDIIEYVGYDKDRLHGTIHTEKFNHMLGTQLGTSLEYPGITTTFIDYSVIWSPGEITLYVDDFELTKFRYTPEFNQDVKPHQAWPFDQEFHLLINLAIGGNWGGVRGIDPDIFPVSMYVDYVRVYQRDYSSLDKMKPEAISKIKTGNLLKNMIYWKKPNNDLDIEYYEIFLNGEFYDTTRLNAYVFERLKTGTEYQVEIVAVDFTGKKSAATAYTLHYQ